MHEPKSLELPLKEFIQKYVRPATEQLARDYREGKPLTPYEQALVREALYGPR